MAKLGILGRKIGMSQIFDSYGKLIPITIVKAGPCWIVQKKDQGKDGYEAIQIGFEKKKSVKVPIAGHFKRAGVSTTSYLREVKVEDSTKYELGEEITVTSFVVGEKVIVTGMSKGKGFSGVVKRWRNKGGKATHGSMFHRAPGSIGQSSDPSRVFKGTKLPGRMGYEQVTVLGVKVIEVKEKENLLFLKGAVPGHRNSIIFIKK